jgi:death-on-curing protein
MDDVLAIQADTIREEGGSPGLRDSGLLESAVNMPRQQFGGEYLHPDLASMAAAYLFHITGNHPFVDGNKRAGAASMLVFLMANGIENLPEPDDLERMTLKVASGEMGKDDLISWIRSVLG